MTIQEFEKIIQKEIHPDLHIKRSQIDLCGVYQNEKYIGVSVPPVHIWDTVDMDYKDDYGSVHKSVQVAKKIIKLKCIKI